MALCDGVGAPWSVDIVPSNDVNVISIKDSRVSDKSKKG